MGLPHGADAKDIGVFSLLYAVTCSSRHYLAHRQEETTITIGSAECRKYATDRLS
jgi:hypothetical protein